MLSINAAPEDLPYGHYIDYVVICDDMGDPVGRYYTGEDARFERLDTP